MNNQPPQRPTDAQRFKAMAERIEHNSGSVFGGAAVITPPANGGEPVEVLILDSSGSPAQFWCTLKTRVEMVLADLQDRPQGPFGRR